MSIKIDPEFKSLIPPLSAEEYSQLEQNLSQDGCRDPLVLWCDTLIDGHNRHAICQEWGLHFETIQLSFESRDEVIDWIINNQLGRRNLTPEQGSYLRGKQYNREKKSGFKGNQYTESGIRQNDGNQTADVFADRFKVSPRTIERDAQFAQAVDDIAEVAPDFRQAVLSGDSELTKEAVVTVASLPAEEMQEVVAKGEREILQKAKEIRAQRQTERRKERIDKILEMVESNPALDTSIGQHAVIYADPPWEYEFCSDNADRIDENHYPTMTLDEIKGMAIPEVTTPDCILFLWATSPKLEEALEVLKAWGFTYKTCAVWVKDRIGMGYYFRQKHELLLVGTKGSIPTPEPSSRPESVISAPFNGHSVKPHMFYELIESMYRELPKLELFSRSPQEGWSAWGNQAS